MSFRIKNVQGRLGHAEAFVKAFGCSNSDHTNEGPPPRFQDL